MRTKGGRKRLLITDNDYRRHVKTGICLFLLIATIVVFWQVKNCEFIRFDEEQYLTKNLHVQSGLTWEGVRWAFTATEAGLWHPMTWLSLMLDHDLYGLNAAGYHGTNLLLHIANAILLFLILNGMTKALWQSGFVAALFALHPLHVESVAWVAQRKDVLSTLFWLMTMGAYFFYVKRPSFRRYLLPLSAFILGLTAKPMLVTLPFALLLLDYWPLGRFPSGPPSPNTIPSPEEPGTPERKHLKVSRLLLEKVPFLILTVPFSVVTFFAQKHAGALSTIASLHLADRLANALVAYVSYIGKMFWPQNLAVFYPHPGMRPLWQFALSGLMLISVSLLVLRRMRSSPYLAVGWLWYLGTLVPVIGLVQVGSQAMADRYTYVSLTGLFIMIAWGIPDLLRSWRLRRVVLPVTAALSIALLMITARHQTQYWHNTVKLFGHALNVTPSNYLAHNNLGAALMDQGDFNKAAQHFSMALRIKPNYPAAHNNMGNIMALRGNYEEAIVHFQKAIRNKPDYGNAHRNLGDVLMRKGEIGRAIYHYRQALPLIPDNAELHNNMGVALAGKGDIDGAIDHLREALRLKSDFKGAQINLEKLMQTKPRSSTPAL